MLDQTLARVRRVPRRVCRSMWDTMPASVAQSPLVHRTGRFIYRRFTKDTVKVQTHFTQFMRNPPLLETLRDLYLKDHGSGDFKVASIGCSTGAELYSVLYILRRSYPDRDVVGVGCDLSQTVVDAAKRGRYVPDVPAAEGSLFDPGRAEITSQDVSALEGMLEKQFDESYVVRDFLRRETSWFAADAIHDDIQKEIGPQDLVLANNFMGPMDDRSAERCLRNMMGLVKPGGFLVVDGLDLDLKTSVMGKDTFTPVLLNQHEIWSSDGSKQGWPWLRWAAEPIDKSDPDWRIRYTIIFQKLQ